MLYEVITLANHGMVVVLLALGQKSGEIIFGPELLTRGFVPEDGSAGYLEQARAAVREALAEHSLEAVRNNFV